MLPAALSVIGRLSIAQVFHLILGSGQSRMPQFNSIQFCSALYGDDVGCGGESPPTRQTGCGSVAGLTLSRSRESVLIEEAHSVAGTVHLHVQLPSLLPPTDDVYIPTGPCSCS